jgi:hypothetical protein
MALIPLPVAQLIATAVKGVAPPPGTPVTDAQLKLIWVAVMTQIYLDLQQNMQVAPGSFVAPAGGGPVSGVGGPAV